MDGHVSWHFVRRVGDEDCGDAAILAFTFISAVRSFSVHERAVPPPSAAEEVLFFGKLPSAPKVEND